MKYGFFAVVHVVDGERPTAAVLALNGAHFTAGFVGHLFRRFVLQCSRNIQAVVGCHTEPVALGELTYQTALDEVTLHGSNVAACPVLYTKVPPKVQRSFSS
jgi:hypothetical protein